MSGVNFVMTDPVPAITEAAATGEIAEIFADIRRMMGVEVVNLNDLGNAVKPVVLPGEKMRVRLVKPGESVGQGVGYLDDGTMVVVEQGRSHLNQDVEFTVTSALQTSAGRMIFGRAGENADGVVAAAAAAATPRRPAPASRG